MQTFRLYRDSFLRKLEKTSWYALGGQLGGQKHEQKDKKQNKNQKRIEKGTKTIKRKKTVTLTPDQLDQTFILIK